MDTSVEDEEYEDNSPVKNFADGAIGAKILLPRRLPKIDPNQHHFAVQPHLNCIMSTKDLRVHHNNVNNNNNSKMDQLAIELAERAVVGSRGGKARSANNHPLESMNFALVKSAHKRSISPMMRLEADKVDQLSTAGALSSSQSSSVLKTILRVKLAFFLSLCKHLGPVIGLVLYTLFGAAVFSKLEYDNDVKEDEKTKRQYEALLKTICYTAFNLNVTDDNSTTVTINKSSKTAEHGIDGSEISIENITFCQNNVHPVLSVYMKQYFRGFGGDTKNWDFMGSAFFAITVYTTIGYGVIVPITDYGRVATIVYAMIGIPLNFFVVADLGILLNKFIRRLWTKLAYYLEKSKVRQLATAETVPQKKKKKAVPLWVALITSYSYLFVGAALFMYEEPKWNFLTAMYFCFQTFATIGFGDIMPENRENLMLSTIYILVGMALLSMCMAIITDNIKKHYVKYSKHLIILQQPTSGPSNNGQQPQQQQNVEEVKTFQEQISTDNRKENMQISDIKFFKTNPPNDSVETKSIAREHSKEVVTTKAEGENGDNTAKNSESWFKKVYFTSKFALFKKP